MLNFDILEMDLQLVSPPHFCMTFREKCFLCHILLTIFHFVIALILEMWGDPLKLDIQGQRGGIISGGGLENWTFHGRHMCIIPTGRYVHCIY